jgi:cobalt-zinc-cadmium resistance protein CzcA
MLALLGLPFAVSGGLVALYVFDLDFQHLGRHRVHLADGGVGDERHPHPQRLLSGGGARPAAGRGHVPSRRRADAADLDDDAVGVHRAPAGGDFNRHRSQVQRPLATVIVGGMLIGPVMLLVVVPALQTLFLREQRPAAAPAAAAGTVDDT